MKETVSNMKSSWMYLIFAAFAVLLVCIVFSNTFMHAALAAFNQTSTNDTGTSLSSNDPKPKSANAIVPVTNTTTTTKTLPTAKDNNVTTSTTSSLSTAAPDAADPTKKDPSVIVFNLDKISVNAAKAPNAPVSNATCGQEAGFPIQFNVNGLAPNTTTMWRLVHSNGVKTQGPWGTFITNSTGGFNEPTFIEELPKDRYHLLFFNSVLDESQFKPSDAVASAIVTVASSDSCTP